jgi:threonine dehydrogenase-like Zn-dependent dehydrogenase
MKAVVFHGIGDVRLDDLPDPSIEQPPDAIVRLTSSSAICGTDLHSIRGTMAGAREGCILGHERVGVVEELGDHVRTGSIDPTALISQQIPVAGAFDAYEQFDRREQGWLKVELEPAA